MDNTLHDLARRGVAGLVRHKLKEGVPVNERDVAGSTALHMACWKGHLPVVLVLREAGGNPDLRDHHGNSALHIAAREGHRVIVELLVKERTQGKHWVDQAACMNITNFLGQTPLYVAILHGRSEVASHLLSNSGEVTTFANDDSTLVHAAAASGATDLLARLLRDYRLDSQARTASGATPLHWASARGRKSAVRFLIEEAGVDGDKRDVNGHAAVDVAKKNVVAFLSLHTSKPAPSRPRGRLAAAEQAERVDFHPQDSWYGTTTSANIPKGAFILKYRPPERNLIDAVGFGRVPRLTKAVVMHDMGVPQLVEYLKLKGRWVPGPLDRQRLVRLALRTLEP